MTKKDEILKRRQKVIALIVAGIRDYEISEQLGVPLRTIQRDIQESNDEIFKELTSPKYADNIISEATSQLKAANRELWKQYTAADKASVKARIMDLIVDGVTKKIEVLRKFGLIRIAPEEIKLESDNKSEVNFKFELPPEFNAHQQAAETQGDPAEAATAGTAPIEGEQVSAEKKENKESI